MEQQWQKKNSKLISTFRFNNFGESVAFVMQVALLAEKKEHHPDILIQYNKVNLELTTHDAGDVITDKDREMAKAISVLYDQKEQE